MGCVASKNKNPKAASATGEEGKKHSDDRTQAQSSSGPDGRSGDKPQKDAMAMTPGTSNDRGLLLVDLFVRQ